MNEPAPASRLTEFVYRHLLGRAQADSPFQLTPQGHLQITADKPLLLRETPPNVRSHQLDWKPQLDRREGGSVLSERCRFALVQGCGELLYAKADNENFQILELERDCCYFAQPVLFAFQQTVVWETGIVPLSPARGWSLDRIAGSGTIIVRLPKGVMAVKISSEEPYRIRWGNFVGSVGNLVWTAVPGSHELLGQGDGAALISLEHSTSEGIKSLPDSGIDTRTVDSVISDLEPLH